MTDVWDAEYNYREKGAGMQDQDHHMEKIKCNYNSITTTEDEFNQFAFFTPAALASRFATDTKAHCDQKIQIHDK